MKVVSYVYLFGNIVCICTSDRRSVTYTRVGSASGSASYDRVTCAEACADSQYLAARVNDVTGICEALTWDWGSDPQYESGFTYFRKIETIQIYEPVHQLDRSYSWLIPGSFGVGAWLEFYFTMPTGNWDWFAIEMLDSVDFSHSVYSGESEVIMGHIFAVKSTDKLVFKAWYNGWTNKKAMDPMPFEDGETYKITIVPHATVMQILFDDVEVVTYSHPTDPRTAKQIKFGAAHGAVLKIHNITFVGI